MILRILNDMYDILITFYGYENGNLPGKKM